MLAALLSRRIYVLMLISQGPFAVTFLVIFGLLIFFYLVFRDFL
jgi:hypothetical protein